VLSLSLDNTWQVGREMDLTGVFSAYYQSDSENFIDQTSQLNQQLGSFTLLNANLTLAGDEWSAMLYVRNLTDEAAPTGAFANGYWSYDTGVFENWYGNGNRQFIAQPRTIGLRLGYRF